MGWSDVPCARKSPTSESSSCCLLAVAVAVTETVGRSVESLLAVDAGSHVMPNAFLMVRCATTSEGATYKQQDHDLFNDNSIVHLQTRQRSGMKTRT